MKVLSELLASRPVICDGAMGTELYARTGAMDICLDHLNLNKPDVVRSVHRDYVDSGAQIIETNTFGANRIRLAAHGLADSVKEINVAGAQIAKEEAGDKALVVGSIGPIGKLLEPFGSLSLKQVKDVYTEQVEALISGGVDAIMVETMSDLEEVRAAVLAAKSGSLPIIAQMSFAQEGNTMMGVTPSTAAREIESLGADVVGANCGTGFFDMLSVVKEMINATALPVIAQPNAGFPKLVDGRMVYMSSPEYMAKCASQFVEIGVAIIGGCCGTTPNHIRAIAGAVRR